MRFITCFSLLLLSFSLHAAETNKDIEAINKAADIMGPGGDGFDIDSSWKSMREVVDDSDFYDDVVSQIADAVCSNDYNKSVLLIGESSDAYKYIYAKLSLAQLECDRYWHFNIDQASLIAGHSYIGQMEGFWKKHITQPAQNIRSLFYLDNLFPILGLGTTKNHPTGLESILSKDVSSGKLNLISFIDKSSLERAKSLGYSYVIDSFSTQIFIEPMSSAEVIDLAQRKIRATSKRLSYEKRDLIFLQRQLAAYQPNILEPSRTVNAITKLLSGIKKNLYKKTDKTLNFCFKGDNPGSFEKLIKAVDSSTIQLELSNVSLSNYFNSFKIIDEETGALLEEITTMEKSYWLSPVYKTSAVRLIFTSNASMSDKGLCVDRVKFFKEVSYRIDSSLFRKAILDNSNVPDWVVNEDYSRLRSLEDNLNAKIIGARESKKTLVRLAKSAYVTNRSDDKPLASTLLAGPTGTGKSFTAKVISKELGLKRIVFDMTAYQTPYDVAGFVKKLTTQLAVYPWGLYLFEEIDKAHPAVLDRLFFMMDEGIVYDNSQRIYSARGAFVMMTTNAASQDIIDNKNHPDLRAIVNKSLQRSFRLSFLNRYDSVLIFKPFNQVEQRELAAVQIKNKVRFLEEKYEWKIDVDEELISYVATKATNDLYGARPMERLIEYILNYSIAEYQIEYGRLGPSSKIRIRLLDANEDIIEMSSGRKSVEITIDTDFNTGSFREALILDLFR